MDTEASDTLTIAPVAGDNTVNAHESHMPTFISGDVGGDAKAGDHVVVSVNGQNYDGIVVVGSDGKLHYEVPLPDGALHEGSNDVKVTVTSFDAAGNEAIATATQNVVVDTEASDTLTITPVAGDNTVNAHESHMPTFISGDVGGDAKAGDHVVVSVNGHDYDGVVVKGSDGKLHYEVPLPDGALHEGSNDVKVTVTSFDAAGNEAIAIANQTVTVDTQANTSVTVNDVTQDNTLNHSELSQHNQTITGFVGGDAQLGDEVTLEINGHYYVGHVVDMGNGKLGYKIPVPSSEFGDNNTILHKDVSVTVTVISHDAAGNEAISSTDHTIHVDNHAYNGLNINTVAGDNVVNHGESQHDTMITGDVNGKDAKAGDKVVVTIDGHNYDGVVVAGADGHLHYEVPVPPGILHEGDNDVSVTVTSFDVAGNVAVATQHTHVTLDTHADASINIHDLSAGPTLNYDELNTPKQLVTGDVGGDAKVGDKVVLDINGHIYTGKVVDLGNGHLGYQIPVDSSAFGDNLKELDGNVKIIATVTSYDAAGNEVTVQTDHTVHIDNHAAAGITIDPITGDGIINYSESQQDHIKVTGTVNGDVHIGDKVIIIVNGHAYVGTVFELPHQNGALGYSIDVPTGDLLADPHPTAYIGGHDDAGNVVLTPGTENVRIDLHADATITINPVTGDNMINGVESHNGTTTITGTVGGDVKVGDLVHLDINGIDMTTHVFRDPVTGALEYSFQVSTFDLMSDPDIKVTVTGTDDANNVVIVSATQHIIVDTQVDANITVDPVTSDNTLNDMELHNHFTLVTGKVTGEMHVGDPVTLTVNGHTYHGFVENEGVDSNGNPIFGYRIPVDTADIQADPHIHASIDVTDAAQNHTVATADHSVGIDDHATATITINKVTGDDVLNGKEQQSGTTTINGRVSGDVHAGDIVHVFVNGVEYDAVVGPQGYLNGGLGYSVDVSTAGLLADPHITATVDGKDAAGNTITVGTTHDVSHDDAAHATITIDPVTDDNVINNHEAHDPKTTITGHATGDVNPGDVVDLDINGQHYYGTLDKNLNYSIDVSTDDLLSQKNPLITASVNGHDAAGNTIVATSERGVGVDTRADVHLDQGSSTPHGSDFYTVTGHVSGNDVHVGDPITYTFAGHQFTTNVVELPDGSGLGYLFNVGTGDAHAHPDITLSITETDPFGNTNTSVDHIHIHLPGDPTQPGGGGGTTPHNTDVNITISPVAGNDVINQQESQADHTIVRGTVSGDVNVGDDVTLHIGNHTYTGHVFELPNLPGEYGYAIDVDTNDLLNNPDITATVAAHDDSSVIASADKTISVDTDVNATIHINTVAGDGTINIAESHNGTTNVSGTVTGDVNVGDNVTLIINGHEVTTQVFRDPKTGLLSFSTDVSTDDLLQDPNITASVTGHDGEGNSITVIDHQTVAVDTNVDATVTIDPVGHNNVLNLADTQQDHTEITGKVSGDVHPGDHVKVTVNGHEYDAVVDKNDNYSVDVLTSDLEQGGKITAQVTGYDDAGNTITKTATDHVTVDTTASGTIDINTVSGDDVLSHQDLQSATTKVNGVVGGDAKIGDEVIITVNGHQCIAHVEALPNMNGVLGYVADVNTNDLQQDPHIHVQVTGTDAAGNTFTADSDKTLTIDDHADVTLHFNNVSGDNVLNMAESHNTKTTISGTVTGDVHDGDKVIVHVNGNDLLGILHQQPDGTFTFSVDANTSDLLADPNITYTVTGVDQYGNTLTITENNTITIDQVAENHIHIGTIAGDDKVNMAEASNSTTSITGTVDGDVHAGDDVTLTINGHIYHGKVVDHNGTLTYDIPVDNSVLHEGDNTVNVTVTGQDAAGNPATSTDTHHFTVDTQIHASITIDNVAGDNTVNAKESGHIFVKGEVGGDAKLGDDVTLDVNGHTVHAKVEMVDGHLGYDARIDKGWLNEGNNDVHVRVKSSDDAGNTITVNGHQNVVLDTHAEATMTIAPIAGDNVVNGQESQHLFVDGKVGGDAKVGDEVRLDVNGHFVDAKVEMINGHLGYHVPVDKDWLHEGDNTVKVTMGVTDAANNHTTITENHHFAVDTRVGVSVTIDPVAPHQDTNGHNPAHAPLTGQVASDVHDGDKVTTVVNEHHYGTQHPQQDVADDKPHHGSHEHGLSNLFADSNESLFFNLHHDAKGHHGDEAHHIYGIKESGDHGKVDLSDLAHELHEVNDITQYIKGGEGHEKGDAGNHVVHSPTVAPIVDAPHIQISHDSHGSTSYSLDHLIAKPEHYSQ
ncbi:Ig-like domain-containing protein [Buttiauxella sp. W03-F01]|nr:Ig-like domain-containing protein [Buttiauxella sp. S04-F03]